MSDLFLRACRGERVERPPVWLMRQAGRYMADYREVRSRVDFLTLCKTPELAAQVTLQPIDSFGMDAAILFSDILVPAEPLGVSVRFDPAPVIEPAVRTAGDVARLREADPEDSVPFVYEAIRILRRELAGRVPLIGFAAAPFTLAAYLVEGRGTKGFDTVRALLLSDPSTAHRLLETVASMTERYCAAQVRAGAQAIQLFDSWAGLLGPEEYREFAFRHADRVLRGLAGLGVPRIYFALNSAHVLDAVGEIDAEVVGVDWRTPLDVASERLGGRHVVQGNLDPCVLLSDEETIRARVRDTLRRGARARGHVFNLGHGVLPTTPEDHVRLVVDTVRAGVPES